MPNENARKHLKRPSETHFLKAGGLTKKSARKFQQPKNSVKI